MRKDRFDIKEKVGVSLLGRIFGPKSEATEKSSVTQASTPEFDRLLAFGNALMRLLNEDRYIARSDYKPIVGEYADIKTFFLNLQTYNLLGMYCEKNGLDEERIKKALALFEELENLKESPSLIKKHNDKFLAEHLETDKEYLDTILLEVDPAISLDAEQRKVVLSDEDYTLVVAGAGAGKTTTMAAKVKYLVEKKGVKPEDILVISFTNKAVGELEDKIVKALHINCPVSTFHRTGYTILRENDAKKRNIKDEGFMWSVITDYLKNDVLKKPEMVEKLILLFGTYFDAPYTGEDMASFFSYMSKADFATMKNILSEDSQQIINKRTKKAITINYETLRSSEEVVIANFLYLNKIDYIYENPYPYSFPNSHRAYTPDFTITQNGKTIYIEHFGITEAGTHSRYTPEQLEKYKWWIKKKVSFHKEHGTDLIFTFSKYNDGRTIVDDLRNKLVKKGIVLEPRDRQEVYEKIVSTEENKYIANLVKLICRFIHNFKANGYSMDMFRDMRNQSCNVRTQLFLDVCRQCYMEYTQKLDDANAVDFEDMINDSAKILKLQQDKGVHLDYKYIIIDEYQDISRQRFNLAQELAKISDAKIIAVGDDWQSIFAYAGSDISLFTKFSEIMGYGEELLITRTYRNSQEVIDVAGNFIQKNTSQIRKHLESPKHIDMPFVVEAYSEEADKKDIDSKNGKLQQQATAIDRVIGQIIEANKAEGKPANSSILLIGRYGFDASNLARTGRYTYNEKTGEVKSMAFPDVDITFLTAHRSKGLGFDNVIIINATNGTYGFPSMIEDDPVLQLVVHSDRSIEYAEERRLFYVAMTRTKNRVYIVVPQSKPSRFIAELVQDYPGIKVNGELDIDKTVEPVISVMKRCPVCGYPMQYKYKRDFGLRLWICTNEPEICDFMTNDLKGGTLPILKCDRCGDGYLIVKRGKGRTEPFLGCTNYKADKTGCRGWMTKEYYEKNVKNKEY